MKLSIVFLLGAGIVCAKVGDYPAAKQGSSYMWNYYLPPAPSSTPWAPAWSPDGKSLAIAMDGSIWRVDLTGAATELTYDRKYHSSPTWSPDGKWIVYTADDDGNSIQLEILNVETGESHALTSDAQVYLDPHFSPDGQRLCYVSTQPNGHFNIYIRSIRNGDWAGEAIAVTHDHSYPRDRLYFGKWDMNTQPAWTPDGKQIIFVSNRTSPLGSGSLWRMPAEENGADHATMILDEQTLYRTRPDVSIDGERIVYSSTAGAANEFTQLYVIPITGGAPYKLTFRSHDHFSPRWSPDGEWIAYISNEGGLPQLCLLETYGGAEKRISITHRTWKREMGRIHVTVHDESGQITPARIHFVASDGKFYTPADAYSRIGFSNLHVFHTPGSFSVDVPPGSIRIQAFKGFEYEPAEANLQVTPNHTTEATLTLRRIVNMAQKGWYSGSTHVHMNYGGNLLNSLPNMMMMSAAEGQDVLNVLVANKDNRVFDTEYFVPGGGEHPISRGKPGVKVVVGEEYRPAFGGHLFLIGLRDHLISPFTTGYEGTAIASLYPSNTDVLRKAISEGAVAGYAHPFNGDADPLDKGLEVGKTFPVDAALGTVQCLEWSYANHAELTVYHHVLDLDLPIAPSGGEDSITSLHRGKLVASARTYAYVPKNFSVLSWFDALRHGHTFFSTGPLIDFRINGKIPGDVIHLPASGGTVKVEGSVWSIAPLSTVVIYNNGKILKRLPASGPFSESFQVSRSGWYTLYAEGPPNSSLDAGYPQATTSAIRIYVGDEKIQNSQSAEYFITWMQKLRVMAEEWPWWRSDAEKNHVLAQYNEAQSVYEKIRDNSRP